MVSRHLSKRRLFIRGEIDSEYADVFALWLMHLKDEGDEPVRIFIDCPGGEVDAGLMMYDLITGSGMDISLYCTGRAYSMGAVLLAAGEKGKRFILPHSKTMIHEPLITSGMGGSATSLRNISDSVLKVRDTLNEILAAHTGKTKEEVDKATAFDNFMDARESIEFGLCDRIVTSIM